MLYNNPPKTLFIGQNRMSLPECHSTNDTAAELCAQGFVPEGTVVITANQTRGRGQRGNVWLAQPGKNLTFSVVLHPHFLSATRQFELNVAVSLAVHHFLSEYLPHQLAIKWPNDVYWRDLKMGGILIENTLRGSLIAHSVVGIGLNINQRHFPDTLRATSLALSTNRLSEEDDYDLEILLAQLLVWLEKFYLKLRADANGSLRASYLPLLYGFGTTRRFRDNSGQVFEGTITDVAADGRILVQTDNHLRHFAFKEIELLFDGE